MARRLQRGCQTSSRAVCGNDEHYSSAYGLLRVSWRHDPFDRPMVIRQGSVYVTTGTDRRSKRHPLQPRSLTEPLSSTR